MEWGFATRMLADQIGSGDRHLVEPLPDSVLLAVVDGLGHGEEAASVAEIAVATLKRHAREPLLHLLKQCHEDLLGTRGVVMSLAFIDAPNNTLSWLGVGDVEGVLLRNDVFAGRPLEYILLRGGVVGYRLPPVKETVLTLRRDDTLIFATDGIHREFVESLARREPVQAMADRILAKFGKQTDDALVLVARYLGGTP